MAVPQLHGQEVEAVTAAKDMAKAARKAEEVLQALKMWEGWGVALSCWDFW